MRPLAIAEAVIDLVRDDLDIPRTADIHDRFQFLRRNDRAGGIGRTGDDDAGGRRIQQGETRRRKLKTLGFAAGNFHGDEMERL